MSKLILFNLITIDGLFEGTGKDISWHNVDAEFNEFAAKQLDNAGALIFGRITYELMASYWPLSGPINDDPVIANKMNSISKIVFSTTLDKADWSNTKLVKGNIREEIEKLKQDHEKDVFILGSANLAATFRQLGLIDEYRLLVNPLILGKGNPMFTLVNQRENLKFINARSFKNGNVLLTYQKAD